MAYADITSGTLSGYEDVVAGTPPDWRINIQQATIGQRFDTFNITAQSQTEPVFTSSKRINLPISGTGYYQLSADAGSTYTDVHSTDNMTNISGALYGKVTRAVLTKQTPFINTTNTSNPIPDVEYTAGMPAYYGSLRGNLQSTGETTWLTNHNTSQATLVIPLATAVTASGLAEVTQTSGTANFRDGGPVPADYSFRYSGGLTISRSPFDLQITSWATTDLLLANGLTLSGTIVVKTVSADMNFMRGGPVPYTFQGTFTGTVT
jgi:hypothetical protein